MIYRSDKWLQGIGPHINKCVYNLCNKQAHMWRKNLQICLIRQIWNNNKNNSKEPIMEIIWLQRKNMPLRKMDVTLWRKWKQVIWNPSLRIQAQWTENKLKDKHKGIITSSNSINARDQLTRLIIPIILVWKRWINLVKNQLTEFSLYIRTSIITWRTPNFNKRKFRITPSNCWRRLLD